MAVNTVTRRMSISQIGGESLDFLPKPDNGVQAKDRMLLLNLYSGIEDSESGAGGSNFWWHVYAL